LGGELHDGTPARPVPVPAGLVRGGRVLEIAPAILSLDEPRMRPCEAGGIGAGSVRCGATPASRWRKVCLTTPSHARVVDLCSTHALMINTGGGACSDCLARGHTSAVRAEPVDLLLLGHAGSGQGR
jgi:hypothetical protein